MNNETWFTAQEAFDAGLVDEIVDRKKKTEKEQAKSILNSCRNFKKAPVEFLNNLQTIVDMADKTETVETNDDQNTIWESVKAFFKSNPKEVKDLISEVEKETAEQNQAEIENARQIAIKNGFYKEPASEENEEEVLEEPTSNNDAELEAKEEEIKALKESIKMFEAKHGAPSAGDGGDVKAENNERITIKSLVTSDKGIKSFFENMAKNLNV
jgi:enoyl-CoA hydratase/carnithine racemase